MQQTMVKKILVTVAKKMARF